MPTIDARVWEQWAPCELPSAVFALTSGDGGIWAGGVGGVAWFPTTDMMGVWQPRIANLPLSSVTALCYQDGLLLAGGLEGIAVSYNGGRQWQQAELEDGVASITTFALSPRFAEDRTIVAATIANGILRSSDGGRTWTNASFGLESIEVTALTWGTGSTILAATTGGLYRSPNAGRAWKLVYEYLEEGPGIDGLICLPDGTLLASVDDGGLLRSSDGGFDWFVDETVSPGLHIVSLYLTRKQTVMMGTVEQGLLRSTTNGRTWQPLSDHIMLAFTEEQGMLYAGTDHGLCMSYDDGVTWRNLPVPPIHDLRQLSLYEGLPIASGSCTGIVRYSDDQTYTLLAPALALPMMAFAVAPDGSLFHSSPAGLARSTDGGASWQIVLSGDEGQVSHLTFRQEGQSWSGWAGSADGSRLLRSLDGGQSWQPLSAPFGILPLAALQAVPLGLLAATYDARQYRATLWHSPDDGETWMRSAEAETQWPHIAACPDPALITVAHTVIMPQLEGPWLKIPIGNDGGMIRRVVTTKSNDQTILFALTTTGLYRSDDQGTDWQRDNDDLPTADILDIAIDSNYCYLLLTGGRLWRRYIEKACCRSTEE